ncbi:MAG: hypothetical protein JWQ27_580 [Ferruginibacter sp.]|nr:hypothetical protein [Ferruginibacter sp.]
MDTTGSNRQIALDWIAAFNEHNLPKLLELYAADALHYSPKLKIKQPETKGWVSGKRGLSAWWAAAFNDLPSLKYELRNLIVNADMLMMEYRRSVDGEPDLMVAEILEIQNGLIVRSRVFHG